MNKKLYKEMKRIGWKVMDFYGRWSRYYRKKDDKTKLTARKCDLLTRDIFCLINERVEPDAEGLIVAMIAIIQSYNYLRHCLPYGIDKELLEMVEGYNKLFYGDSWRWVKHDHMQIAYDFFFGGKKVDGDKLKNDIDGMLAREDINRNNN